MVPEFASTFYEVHFVNYAAKAEARLISINILLILTPSSRSHSS